MRKVSSTMLLGVAAVVAPFVQAQQPVTAYVSSADRSHMRQRAPQSLLWQSTSMPQQSGDAARIVIDPTRRLQTVEGFGFALTDGSALLLHRMSPAARHRLLLTLFGSGEGELHVSALRLTIGASDMSPAVYTYDDVPAGQTDPQLSRFSLAAAHVNLLPVLHEILAIQPQITLMASPWSAPVWMKTNGATRGGTLRPDCYAVYAKYLVRYLKGMQADGVHIAAITPQNEPLNANNNPSMTLQPEQEAAFIREALGPALRQAGLATRVVVYDHNLDKPQYAEAVLSDTAAAQYIDGSAFHLYAGQVSAMTAVHDAFPTKSIYFTEQMTVERPQANNQPEPIALPVAHIMIGALRNWSRLVLLWNLAADPSFGPHTPGGCGMCQGAVTLDGDEVQENIALDTVAQFSRFVPPNSLHIESTEADTSLPNVAFLTPDGKTVLVIANLQNHLRNISVVVGGQSFRAQLDPTATVTYVW